jgi:hypothetical protein
MRWRAAYLWSLRHVEVGEAGDGLDTCRFGSFGQGDFGHMVLMRHPQYVV